MITYREFAPAAELVGLVRAYHSFMPETPRHGHRPVLREVLIAPDEPFWTPMLADARVSLSLDLGATCHAGKGWIRGTPLRARVVGPFQFAGDPAGSPRSEMVGVYFEPGAAAALLGVPASELTDRVVSLEDIWGARAAPLVAEVAELDEAARIERLEVALRERLLRSRTSRPSIDVTGLARWVRSEPGSMTVSRLAQAAGVSRRHLARVFRQVVGVSPKRYSRIARFQAGLRYAGIGPGVKWAQVAAELGYADQSHMIAEFRELSNLTPEALATQKWFHPFILETRSRLSRPPLTIS